MKLVFYYLILKTPRQCKVIYGCILMAVFKFVKKKIKSDKNLSREADFFCFQTKILVKEFQLTNYDSKNVEEVMVLVEFLKKMCEELSGMMEVKGYGE